MKMTWKEKGKAMSESWKGFVLRNKWHLSDKHQGDDLVEMGTRQE